MRSEIESKFDIVTAHRVAHLHYHEFLPHGHFILHGETAIVDENEWMVSVLSHLKHKSGKHWKGSWEVEREKFRKLVERHIPKILHFLRPGHPQDGFFADI